ncbi:MAG: hypothetical protein AB7P23_05075 [Amphiplicatus sp.]
MHILLPPHQLTPEAPPLEAGVVDPGYAACIERVEKNVEDGRKAAAQWAADTGRAPALHCLAVADLAAGYPKVAAIRLDELGGRDDAGDAFVRARIYSQAALSWLEADRPDLAEKSIDAAFALAPEAGEIYLAAAKMHWAKQELQATIDAVTAAEEKGFTSADAYVLRGRALHALARDREAADDVVAALTLDPRNLDALVLRGDLYAAGIKIDAHYRIGEKGD